MLSRHHGGARSFSWLKGFGCGLQAASLLGGGSGGGGSSVGRQLAAYTEGREIRTGHRRVHHAFPEGGVVSILRFVTAEHRLSLLLLLTLVTMLLLLLRTKRTSLLLLLVMLMTAIVMIIFITAAIASLNDHHGVGIAAVLCTRGGGRTHPLSFRAHGTIHKSLQIIEAIVVILIHRPLRSGIP